MVDERELIGELIRLRNANDLSQRDIAKQIGVSYATVQAIESGKVSIWLGDALKWVAACNADPALWFADHLSPEQQKERAADKEMLAIIRRGLRVKERRVALDAICQAWKSADARAGKRGKP